MRKFSSVADPEEVNRSAESSGSVLLNESSVWLCFGGGDVKWPRCQLLESGAGVDRIDLHGRGLQPDHPPREADEVTTAKGGSGQ